MWSFMESARPSVFPSSNVEGVERVVKGKGKFIYKAQTLNKYLTVRKMYITGSYAFLMESTSIEYVIERNCELTQVGSMLDSKGYGIAMPPSNFYKFLLYYSNVSIKSFSPNRLSISNGHKRCCAKTPRGGKVAHPKNALVEGKERWWFLSGKSYSIFR